LEFVPTESEDEWAERWFLQQDGSQLRPLVAIHPGSGASVKLWLPEKWAQVADRIADRRGVQVVITGSADELDLAWEITARARSQVLVASGETTLGQLAAIYRRCRLVLGPDCGPLHLAVAVGTPTLHLYGPVDTRTFGPWGNDFRHRVLTSRWPCVPCDRLDFSSDEVAAHPCVKDISIEQVLSEAEAFLAGTW
jgi:heptosyltransferase-2/heptosyltransferase-3